MLGRPAAGLPGPQFRGCTPARQGRPAQICRANYRWSAGEQPMRVALRRRHPPHPDSPAGLAVAQQCNSHTSAQPLLLPRCLAVFARWYAPAVPPPHHADDAGSRKRESLYGSGDGGEPGSRRGGAAAAASNSRDGDWQGQGGEQEQQAAWESTGGAITSERSARRRARNAAAVAGDDSSSGSRMGRRRQQQQQEQQEGEQQEAAESEPAGSDPWVEAELRQLRRRRASRAGAAGEAGAADPWAQEWGPLEGAPAAAAAAAEDFGWAAESWANNGAGNDRSSNGSRQQREADEVAGAGPGSSWDLRQQEQQEQQQSPQQRRRRRRAGAAGDGDEQPQPSAGDSAFGAAANGSQGRYGGYEQLFEDDNEEGWEQQQQQEAGQYGGAAGQYGEAYEPGLTAEPDIALFSAGGWQRRPALPCPLCQPFLQAAIWFECLMGCGLARPLLASAPRNRPGLHPSVSQPLPCPPPLTHSCR